MSGHCPDARGKCCVFVGHRDLVVVRIFCHLSAGLDKFYGFCSEISHHLNDAQIILLLVSPDFMASEYCYGIEMQRALERHHSREARVIPIILRHVYWRGILGNLQALPTDAKPVKSWLDIDEALFDVTEGIRKVVKEVTVKTSVNFLKQESAKPLPYFQTPDDIEQLKQLGQLHEFGNLDRRRV